MKKKSLNNKGFSLVELIIVIAIMAVLIGVLAPQYIKYVEKSRVSTDAQLIDNVYQAMNACYIDPLVTDKPALNSSGTTLGTAGAGANDFWKEVYAVLGVADYAALKAKLQATGAGDISYAVDGIGAIKVTNTNSSGTISVPGGMSTTS